MSGVRLPFQIMAFVIIMNVSIGLVSNLFPTIYGSDEFRSGLYYSEEDMAYINSQSETELTPGTQVSGGSGFFSSILDALTAGYYSKIKAFIVKYFYGISTLLESVFSPYMSDELSDFFFDKLLDGMLTTMYIFGVAWMFTGKNFFDKGV